ncbi:MAG TPA: cation transporter [Methanomassiliicoccaceae archaeon]|jgi:copper chaperone|nr:heavy-metal-associated domain-containing protein [Euryarchaeota archaeon]HOB38203.1 cation transporter [Methanomassiliicoccaceae archaeon]HOK28069.1 cation transporter [Methanomassiliicoccaceae archaeon]HOL07492.1 cation transporter [Methanomassiliicoccaceae archaeon]HQA20918.1 cation transporter [Methanomassiliicoccaceae archaeon]
MSEITLNVKGMKCGGCKKRVEDALVSLPGVSSVKIDLKKGEVQVAYDETSTGPEQIRKKIGEAGYQVA